jgi:hypothetical protein
MTSKASHTRVKLAIDPGVQPMGCKSRFGLHAIYFDNPLPPTRRNRRVGFDRGNGRLRLASFAFHVSGLQPVKENLIVFGGRSQNSNLRRFCYDGRS